MHLFHVFCMRTRSPLVFLSMYLLFSLGPNTRTLSTTSGLVRYMYEMMPAHERPGSRACTAMRRAATCSAQPLAPGAHVPPLALRNTDWGANLCVLEHSVGALPLALKQRPARAVVQDFKHCRLFVGAPRHVRAVYRLRHDSGCLFLCAHVVHKHSCIEQIVFIPA